ncbi:DegQ family serine endoprotease [Chthonobacter rhizosphaerae]|uniref:DegQ family serine endoprotease n=1 Tax=Chthonobacter rhizosphaerae TaxID=2735553 RepID=UPI0015EE9677|nr:DegQ family serine endoprotease [Chthonobacter rhizosphaerae]
MLRHITALILTAVLAGPAAAQDRAVPLTDGDIKLSFAPVAREASPAVVNVYASRRVADNRSALMDDPFFRQFFGRDLPMPRRERQQNSLGSGVIVDPSGLIVTNNHVIAEGTDVKVALSDRREYECDVVLKDEQLDIAILKIRDGRGDFPALPIGDSDKLQVGDLVLAIGNPFGVGQTVTQGIVSALARSQVGISDYQFFIQTDAAINPGNSGGALVDVEGALVGINTAIFSRGGGSNGIGFAIPSNMVRVVIDQARKGGSTVELPWIGAEMQPVTADIAETLGLERPSGVLITSVIEDSPAEEAGLKVGDLVTAVDGAEVSDPRVFNYRLATKGIGNEAELSVNRDGRETTIRVPLEPPPASAPREEITVTEPSPFQGATVANLSPAVARELNMPYRGQPGVVITKVARRSPAARVGLAPGDVIVVVNGTEITSTEDLAAITSDNPLLWRLTLDRGGRIIRLAFR